MKTRAVLAKRVAFPFPFQPSTPCPSFKGYLTGLKLLS